MAFTLDLELIRLENVELKTYIYLLSISALIWDIWVHNPLKCSNYPITGKTLDLKDTNLDVKYEYKDSLFMLMIWGLLNISLNFPNAVNTLKQV